MKHLLITFTFLLCLSACDTKETNMIPEGSWSLISIYCECAPVELEIGDHNWKLDVEDELLEVTNNTTLFADRLLATGTYDISVDDDLITVEGTRYQMIVDGNTMTFDSNYPNTIDAPILTFQKN